ncbi:MAG: hypothetical protein BGO77_04410 [Caedibacter sp. 37-49]|nr:MAG: hypothetical protein BGO77_04410 [Caedibacter sp. 37-49]
MRYLLYVIYLSISFTAKASILKSDVLDSDVSSAHYSILLVEEGAHSLGFYNSKDGKEYARVALSSLPHEIAISADQTKAYIPNFGLRDYDLTIGNAGNSISVIDLVNQCEIYRLYTTFNGQNYWAPHGVKIKGDKLYVNVECTSGRLPDTTATLGQQTRILVFDLSKNKSIGLQPSLGPPMILKDIALPHVVTDDAHEIGSLNIEAKTSYSVLAGTHNFVFSPLENKDDLWYYAGFNGVCLIDSKDGRIKLHLPTTRIAPNDPISFNGAVRGISFSNDGKSLVVAAYNQVTIIDTAISEELSEELQKLKLDVEKVKSLTKKIVKLRINDLGVSQLFYPKFTHNTKNVLVPAPLDNQVLVIDVEGTGISEKLETQKRVKKRIVTGVDPLQVMISPDDKVAYVTNADSPWISRIDIDLEKFELLQPDILIHQTMTAQGGPNGMALSKYFLSVSVETLKLGTFLPLTGKYAGEARECRLGLQFWEQMINAAGGVIWQGKRHHIKIIYEDTESRTDNDFLKNKVEILLGKDEPLSASKNNGIVAVLGTYPPAANKPIAEALRETKIPFITSTGREPDLFKDNPGHVFGISPVKHEADLISTLRALFHGNNLTSKPHKILILACNDLDSISEAEGLVKYAQDNEIKILSPLNPQDSWIKYVPDTDKINDLIRELSSKAQEKVKYCPDILFVIGQRQESLDMVKACRKYNFSTGGIALNTGIINPAFMTQLGSIADNLLGSVCWWDSCCDFAYDRFVSSSDFQRNFYSIYGQNPSELVAGFAASGIVFEEALKQEILNPLMHNKNLNYLIANLTVPTFYGPIKFDKLGQNEKKKITTVRLERVGSTLKATSLWPK